MIKEMTKNAGRLFSNNRPASKAQKKEEDKMNTKFFLAFAAVIALSALLLSASAQIQGNFDRRQSLEVRPMIDRSIDIGTQVNLKIQIGGPSEFPTIIIINSTNHSIPPGKKLYWRTNSSMNGSIVLATRLGPGQSVKTSAEAAGTSYAPAAWYFQ
jgi:hypothetical protein